MIRFFLYFLGFLILITFVFLWLYDDPGYVLVSVGRKTYEMSFFVALILNIFLILSIMFFFKLSKFILEWPNIFTMWLTNKKQKKIKNNTMEGLVAFTERDWLKAKNILLKSADNSKNSVINFLFAAKASSHLGDYKGADNLLKKAELESKNPELSIILTKAELQFYNCQYEQCLATLLRVKKSKRNSQVLMYLIKVYDKLSDYESLLDTINSFKKNNTELTKDIDHFAERAAVKKIISSAEKNIDSLRTLDFLPKFLKNKDSVVECCIKELIKKERCNEAEGLLSEQINQSYNKKLIILYGDLPLDNEERRIAYIKNLLKKKPNDPYLFRALGSVSYQQDRFEIAEKYLKKSLKIKKIPGTSRLLGNLYYRQSKFSESSKYYAREFN